MQEPETIASSGDLDPADSAQVLEALLDRQDPIWKPASQTNEDDHSGPNIQSRKNDLMLDGISESGAKITATSEDFERRENKLVLDNPGTSDFTTHMEWVTTDKIKGLWVKVSPPGVRSAVRSVSIFLPDGKPSADAYQRPLEIVVNDESGRHAFNPENERFAQLEDEIKYYLGDNVVWGPGTDSLSLD